MTPLIGIWHALSFEVSLRFENVGFWKISRMTMDCPQIACDPRIRWDVIPTILVISDRCMWQASQNCNTSPSERLFQQGRTVRKIWFIFWCRGPFPPNNFVDFFLSLSLSLGKCNTSENT